MILAISELKIISISLYTNSEHLSELLVLETFSELSLGTLHFLQVYNGRDNQQCVFLLDYNYMHT